MESEKEIQGNALKSAGSRPATRLWRNHVGTGWSGKVIRNTGSEITLQNPRAATFGLMVGSADAIGIRRLTIRPEHVGMTFGVFVSAEMKTAKGRLRQAQETWAGIKALLDSPNHA